MRTNTPKYSFDPDLILVFLLIFYFTLMISMHFNPGLQSAVCILPSVCILLPVCSLQSAVCVLHRPLDSGAPAARRAARTKPHSLADLVTHQAGKICLLRHRTSERTPFVQTLREGEGNLVVTRTGERKNAMFFWREF